MSKQSFLLFIVFCFSFSSAVAKAFTGNADTSSAVAPGDSSYTAVKNIKYKLMSITQQIVQGTYFLPAGEIAYGDGSGLTSSSNFTYDGSAFRIAYPSANTSNTNYLLKLEAPTGSSQSVMGFTFGGVAKAMLRTGSNGEYILSSAGNQFIGYNDYSNTSNIYFGSYNGSGYGMFYDGTNRRLGINTTGYGSVAYTLDVNGNGRFSGSGENFPGSFTSSLKLNGVYPALHLENNNNEGWLIGRNAAGNLSFGQTNGSSFSHRLNLSANGRLILESPTSSELKLKSNASGGKEYWLFSTAGDGYGSGDGSFALYNATDNAYRFAVSASGNFGINTATPQYTLDVNGTMRVGSLSTDPGGSSGTLYYNSTANRLKANINGTWKNFLMEGDVTGGGSLSLPEHQIAYGSGSGLASSSSLSYNGSFFKLIQSTTSNQPGSGLLLMNQDDINNGVLIKVGYNGSNNRQLWIGDNLYDGSATAGFVRASGGEMPYIDAVKGNGSNRLYLNLGSNSHGITVGASSYNSSITSKVAIYGNQVIGENYVANPVPQNGLLVEGNTLIGSATDQGNHKLQVNGNTWLNGDITLPKSGGAIFKTGGGGYKLYANNNSSDLTGTDVVFGVFGGFTGNDLLRLNGNGVLTGMKSVNIGQLDNNQNYELQISKNESKGSFPTSFSDIFPNTMMVLSNTAWSPAFHAGGLMTGVRTDGAAYADNGSWLQSGMFAGSWQPGTLYLQPIGGTVNIAALKSGLSSPTQNGVAHMVTVDANGLLGHQAIPSGSGTSGWALGGNAASASDFIGTTNNQSLLFKANNTEGLRIIPSGQVGIATTSATSFSDASYKLFVEGGVRARKVKVDVNGWSDYVFYPSYRLPSLKEVEQFIKQHQHLPDVPSEQEVKKQGIDVAETQAMLLKKIEELTLYAIEQEKEIETLKTQNHALEQKLEKVKNLEEEMMLIKSLLKK